MGKVLAGLAPEKVFHYFEEICAIPHGSYHVDEISDYFVAFAKERNLPVVQDAEKNVIIYKKASPGMEDAPTVILQGHMDMVCEKNADCDHDFLKDGLHLEVSGDDVYALGTTLGGDDGIAAAYALAILDDDTVIHPNLEVVLTTQEETGMEGAIALDVSKLKGKYLINIDSEEEGVVLTSCAGGVTFHVDYPKRYEKEKPTGECYRVFVHGLKGGHSGTDIHLGRGNAIVILSKFIYLLDRRNITCKLASVHGGQKHNAIPREAEAYLYITPEQMEETEHMLRDFRKRIHEQYAETDEEIVIDFEKSNRQFKKVYCECIKRAMTDAVSHLESGVCHMSEEVEGMVETSMNLGILKENENGIHLEFLVRSSKEEGLDEACDVISYEMNQGLKNHLLNPDDCTMQCSRSGRYPSWEYKADSPLRKLVMDVYEKQYQKPMRVESIHAGLECGIFAGKKDFDMVSIGPDILHIHTPDEVLKISSTKRTYELLLAILRRAKELKN